MTNKDIKSLLELCQRYGVKRVKTADIELELEVLPTPSLDASDATGAKGEALNGQSGVYSDEQILNWSSEGNV